MLRDMFLTWTKKKKKQAKDLTFVYEWEKNQERTAEALMVE